ncbi:hypothetical protein SEA_ALONE_205 [Streptomyces phage Alone3]|nr:hypothetical protein SEA_ALONE_205 [Streptomyces phage Alone3]
MAKRQSNENPLNVVRIDGEGKVHGNGGSITPLCKFRGHGDHTWVTTDEAVSCGRCVNLINKREESRKRLEYAANMRDTQDMDFSQGEPKNGTPVPRAEFTSEGVKVLPAVEPVTDSQGATVTVPVDYDNPSAGRRELDASKGERVIGETTFRESAESIARRERARDEYMRATRAEAPQSAEAVQALIRRLQTLHSTMTDGGESEEFSVTFHEPKNGPALEREIPALPEGVSPNVWELAFTANTESAREYWTRKAKEERTAFLDAQEAMEESRKAVELDTPPF